ncbi:hypothetical protein ACET3Z_006095 [Daucus carota]
MPIEKWTAPAGTWFLLPEVSAFLSKSVDWAFLHHHWKLLDRHEEGGQFKCLLKTISNVSVELPPEHASELALNLLKRVREFNMHLTEVYFYRNLRPMLTGTLRM